MDISNLTAIFNLMQNDLGKHFISHFMKKNFLASRGKSISVIVNMLEENDPVLPTSKRQFEKNASSALKNEVEITIDTVNFGTYGYLDGNWDWLDSIFTYQGTDTLRRVERRRNPLDY